MRLNFCFSLNFGHMMIPGRGTLPLTDINIPDLSWKSDLLEKKVFAVQQDFIKILGKAFPDEPKFNLKSGLV